MVVVWWFSDIALNSDDPSSIPAGYCTNRQKVKKRPRLAYLLKNVKEYIVMYYLPLVYLWLIYPKFNYSA